MSKGEGMFLFKWLLGLFFFGIVLHGGAVAGTVTGATGGTTISADTARIGGSGAWTTLTGPTYAETINGDLNNGTVVLTIPAGFELNTAASVAVVLITGDSNASKNMNNVAVGGNVASTAAGTLTLTTSTITFSITSKSQGNTLNTIRWQGIQIRPVNGYPLASGTITASGTSGVATAANSTNFGSIGQAPGAMSRLLTVLPGQSFTAGTGVTGTPSGRTAGTSFNLAELVATDQFYSVITSYSGTKTISYSGPTTCFSAPSYTTSVSFTSGRSTTTLATTLTRAETTTISASDGTVSGPASSSFTVSVGAASRLVATLPGQSFSACSGNSGTPTAQTAGTSFNITAIRATDAYYNVVTSYSGSKTLSYSGPANCSVAPSYTTAVQFTNGQSTTALATTLTRAETTTISVSDGVISGPASSSLAVGAGALNKLVVTLPGETFTACSGNSGTPSNQVINVPFNLTSITATDAYFNVVTSYSGNRTLAYSGPSGAPSYTTSVNFTAGQSTTTLTTTLNTPETTQITVSNAGISGPASSSFIVANAGPSSFNAFDSSTAAGTTTGGVLTTKVAGSSLAFDIVALTSAPALMTTFTGTVKVELVDASSGVCAAMSVIQTLPNQTFLASENGRHPVTTTEANAWKNVRVRISYPVASPTTVSCSSNNFAIRPNDFTVVASDLNATTAGTARTLNNLALGGTVHKAGRPFTLTATARNAAGVTTTNYADIPTGSISQCATAGICPSTLGVLNFASGSVSAGVLTTNSATYSEVGAFTLTVEDQSFAAVDAADSTTAQRYIRGTVDVGRFVPDHFLVTPGTLTPRSDLGACAGSLFTYMDEPFTLGFTLRARNASNTTTVNYTGTLARLDVSNTNASLAAGHLNIAAVDTGSPVKSFAATITAITQSNPGQVTTAAAHGLSTGDRVYISGVNGMNQVNYAVYTISVIDATRFTLGTNTAAYGVYTSGGTASRIRVSSPSGSWSAGVVSGSATLSLLRSTQADGPYDSLVLAMAPQDLDGVTAASSALTVDADQNGSGERVALATTRQRFGVLRLGNAYGSERLNLPLPIKLSYWNGSAFVTNTLDSCTTLSTANIAFSTYRGGITAANMNTSNVTLGGFSSGVGSLVLSKPSPQPGSAGSVVVSVNLSAEAKSYLQGRWNGTAYDDDPTALAAFGVYRDNGVIFIKEMY